MSTVTGLRRTSWLAAAGLVMCSTVAVGHHPVNGKFNPDSELVFDAIVTKVDWRSPHVHLFVNVGSGSELENWAVELASPAELRMAGWSEDTVSPGDALSVHGITARDGSRQVWGNEVVLSELGRRVFTPREGGLTKPLAARPVPRWDDGHPALGATPGSAGGFWGYPTAKALVEDGVDVEIDEYGQLANERDADAVAPLQDWALALYRYRQARDLRDDPMFINCKPPGGPRQYQSDLGFQLIEDLEHERIFVLIGSGNRNYRIIYLDGRDPVGQVGGDDDNPLYYGRSLGRWDGDTLVVDTSGFNEDFWMTNGGLPHTNQLRLTERFTRTDADTLRYEVLIDDAGAYTRPWRASWELEWVGGQELPVHICQENRP